MPGVPGIFLLYIIKYIMIKSEDYLNCEKCDSIRTTFEKTYA